MKDRGSKDSEILAGVCLEDTKTDNKILQLLNKNILIVVIIFLLIIGPIISKTFLSVYNIQNILINVATIGMLAIGQTLVMLVKEIDLSQGSPRTV